MSIQIVVNDPANTSPADLNLVIALLHRFTGGAPVVIDAPDLPDAGALNGDDAAQAFEAGAQPANAAFGGVAAATPEQAFAPAAPNAPAATAAAPSTPTNGAPPAPGNPASTAGVTLDSAGLPWDARIHAKSSTAPGGVTVANGTWRKKAKVDAALVAQVEGELRALMSAPGVPVGYVEAPFPNVAPPPPHLAPPASPTAAVPGNPVSAPSAAATSFPELVQRVSEGMLAGKIDMPAVTAICAMFGVPDLTLLPQRPDLFPMVAAGIHAKLSA